MTANWDVHSSFNMSMSMTKDDVDKGKRLQKEDEELRQRQMEQAPQGPTVLWRSAAKTVSLITGVSSLAVRTGCTVGTFGLSIGREATQRTLSLNQTVLEMVLKAAGKDVQSRSDIALRHEAVEGLLGRWVSLLRFVRERLLTKVRLLLSTRPFRSLPSSQLLVSTLLRVRLIGHRILPYRVSRS